MQTWGEVDLSQHAFCLFFLLKKSIKVLHIWHMYQEHLVMISCSYCHNPLFEIEHIKTGRKRHMDDLLMEKEVFYNCYGRSGLENVFLIIRNEINRIVFEMSLPKGFFDGKCFVKMTKVCAIRRRLETHPETYDEYHEDPVNYEMEWYDWSPSAPKCVTCDGEYNLHQCVNKCECSHIFCLKCLLVDDNIVDSDIMNKVLRSIPLRIRVYRIYYLL